MFTVTFNGTIISPILQMRTPKLKTVQEIRSRPPDKLRGRDFNLGPTGFNDLLFFLKFPFYVSNKISEFSVMENDDQNL